MCLRLIVRGAAVPNATFPVKLLNARRRRFGAQGDALTAATMTAAAATAGIGDVCYADFLDAVRDVLGNAP